MNDSRYKCHVFDRWRRCCVGDSRLALHCEPQMQVPHTRSLEKDLCGFRQVQVSRIRSLELALRR